MFQAAYLGDLDTIIDAYEQGLNLDEQGTGGWTVAHYAMEYDHLHIVKWLYDHNISLEIEDDEGVTPIWMSRHSTSEIIEFIDDFCGY